MAPKKEAKRAVKAVVTAKKVVEETIEAIVFPPGTKENSATTELVSSSASKEKENVEISTVPVPVRTKSQRKIKGVETAPQPRQSDHDDDETQSFTETETFPIPLPRKREKKEKRVERASATSGEKKRVERASVTSGEKKRKRGGGGEGYKRYVFRVMKQVHPHMGISSKAMAIINNMISDMFERLAEEAARLNKYTGRQTLSSRDVQAAVKLVLPGELRNHAIAEGIKAINNYVSYVPK